MLRLLQIGTPRSRPVRCGLRSDVAQDKARVPTSFFNVWGRLLQNLPETSVTSQLGGTDRYGSRTLATAALDYVVSFGRVTR